MEQHFIAATLVAILTTTLAILLLILLMHPRNERMQNTMKPGVAEGCVVICIVGLAISAGVTLLLIWAFVVPIVRHLI